MATIKGTYDKAIQNGVLSDKVSEERYLKMLQNKDERYSYWKNTSENHPGYFSNKYEDFSANVDKMLGAEHNLAQPTLSQEQRTQGNLQNQTGYSVDINNLGKILTDEVKTAMDSSNAQRAVEAHAQDEKYKTRQKGLNRYMSMYDQLADVDWDKSKLFDTFPEFEGDDNLFYTAYDYMKDYRSGKYTQTELKAKYPEFFGNVQAAPTDKVEEKKYPENTPYENMSLDEQVAYEEEQLKKSGFYTNDKVRQEKDYYGKFEYGRRLLEEARKEEENATLFAPKITPDSDAKQFTPIEENNMEDVFYNAFNSWVNNTAIGKKAVLDYDAKIDSLKKMIKKGSISKKDAESKAEEYFDELIAKASFYNSPYLTKRTREIGNKMVGENIESMLPEAEKKKEEYQKADNEWRHEKDNKYETAYRIADYGVNMGMARTGRTYARNMESPYRDKLGMAEATIKFLEKAKEIREAAINDYGFLTGFKTSISDLDTWDLGIGEYKRNNYIKSVVSKLEDNDGDESKLSEDEKNLLDAYLIYLESCGYNSENVNRWYKAGNVTASAIPFMAETALTGGLGIGAKATRGLMRLSLKKGAKAGMTKSAFRKVARIGAGSLIDTNIQLALFHAPKIAAGMKERQMGDVLFDRDLADATLTYTGVREGSQQGLLESLWNSFITEFGEVYSERAFEKYAPLMKKIARSAVFKDIKSTGLAQTISKIINNPKVRQAKNIIKWNDFPIELLEEEVGGAISFLATDVNSLKEAGLDIDSQIDIVTGLIPMSLVFGGLSAGSAAVQWGKYKRNASVIRDMLSSDEQRKLYEKILNGKRFDDVDEFAHNYIKSIVNSENFTKEEKTLLIEDCLGQIGTMLDSDVKQEISDSSEEEQQDVKENVRDIEKPIKAEIYVTDKNGKGSRRTIIYSGNGVRFNDDGSIDVENSKKLHIKNINGEEITGKERKKWIESLNNTLRDEKKIEDARLLREERARIEKADAAKAAAEEQARLEQHRKEVMDEVERTIPIKEGVVDDKHATPAQTFVWNLKNKGKEVALKRASNAIGEKLYYLENLQDDTSMSSGSKDAAEDRANNFVQQYVQIIEDLAGKDIAQQVRASADAYMNELLQRDIDAANEQEKVRLERIAERQRVREENRRKYAEQQQSQQQSQPIETPVEEAAAETPKETPTVNTTTEVTETPKEETPNKPKKEKNKKQPVVAKRNTELNPLDEDVVLIQNNNPGSRKLNFAKKGEIPEGWHEIDKRIVYAKEGGRPVAYVIRSSKNKFGANSTVSVIGEDGVLKNIYASQLYIDEAGTSFVGSELSSKSKGKLKITNFQEVSSYPVYTDKNGNSFTLEDLLTPHGETSGYEYVRQQVDAENPDDTNAMELFHQRIHDVVDRWNALAETLLDSHGYHAAKLLAYRYHLYKNGRSDAFNRGDYAYAHRIDDMIDGPANFSVGTGYSTEHLKGKGLNNPLLRIACMIEITKDMPGVKDVEFNNHIPEDLEKALKKSIITAKEIERIRQQYKELKSKQSDIERNEDAKRLDELEEKVPEVKTNYAPITRERGKKAYDAVKQYYRQEAGEVRRERKMSKEQTELTNFDDLCKQAVDAFKEGSMDKFIKLSGDIAKVVEAHAKDKVNKFANRLKAFQKQIKDILRAAFPQTAKIASLHKQLDEVNEILTNRQKKVEDLTKALADVDAALKGLKSMIDTKENIEEADRLAARKIRLVEQLSDAQIELERPMYTKPREIQEKLNEAIAANPEAEAQYQEMAKQDFPENGLKIEFSTAEEAPEVTPHTKFILKALQRLIGFAGAQLHHAGNQEKAREVLKRILEEYGIDPEMMGSRVQNRQKEIADKLSMLNLTPEQRVVVDVFTGAKDREWFSVERGDKNIKLEMQQGTDEKTGTKHSIFRHYDTKEGYINAEDILLIPELLRNGERKEDNDKVKYQLVVDGVRYTMVTIKKSDREVFGTFSSNRKGLPSKSSNTNLIARTNEANPKTGDKGTTKNSNTQEKTEKTVEFFKNEDGIILGWAIGNEIWLTDEGLNSETPIHEYTHLWVKSLRNEQPEAWEKIKALCQKNKRLWDNVVNDPAYANIKDDEDAIASEMLSRYSGQRGAKRLEEEVRKIVQKSGLDSGKVVNQLISNMRKALQEFWRVIRDLLRINNNVTLDEVSDLVLKDLFDGRPLNLNTEEMNAIKDQAIEDGTFMKAPNGKPTNLDERQWLSVRTKAFKEWYGDWENPKEGEYFLLDTNGEPMIVFHGTNRAGYDIFNPQDDGESNGRGIFTTPQRFIAGVYAGITDEVFDSYEAYIGRDAHRGIYSLFANIKNPLIVDCTDNEGNPSMWHSIPVGTWKVVGPEMKTQYFNTYEDAAEWMYENGFGLERTEGGEETQEPEIIPETYTTDQFVDLARKQGYDGVIFKNIIDGSESKLLKETEDSRFMEAHEVIVGMQSNQFKSATTNNGLYSEKDARIEYSVSMDELNHIGDIERQKLIKAEKKGRSIILDKKKDTGMKLDELHDVMASYADQMEGMRVIQNSINSYRKVMGLPPLGVDVRTMFEGSTAAAYNQIEAFRKNEKKQLEKSATKLQKAVAKTDFYKSNNTVTVDGKKITLTPLQFIELYLIARNNFERAKEDKIRGAGAFAELMGYVLGESPDVKSAYEQFVEGFHNSVNDKLIEDLWRDVETMTHMSLRIGYEGGLITEDEYEKLSNKKYFVPQRGFWKDINGEKDKEDIEPTAVHKNGRWINRLSFMTHAEGGISLAEGPFAYIYSDVEEAIQKAENNKVKVAFFNMLRDNSDWCSLPEVGFETPTQVFYEADENGHFVHVENGYTPEEIADFKRLRRRVRELEKLKKKLGVTEEQILEYDAEIDEIESMIPLDAINTRALYGRRNKENTRSIGVLVDGYQCEIILPKSFHTLTDAMNGKRVTEGQFKLARETTGFFAAQLTVNNPGFFAVNLSRDIQWISMKGMVEYGPLFNLYFLKNLAMGQKQINQWLITGKFPEGEKWGEYMNEFLKGGANTGFMANLDLMSYRSDVKKLDIKSSKTIKHLSTVKDALLWRHVANYMNEWSELTTRFSAYCSIREMGKSEIEAIRGAKNLSVNFDRKGLGNAFLNIFQQFSVFVNATIQGVMGKWRMYGAKAGSSKSQKTGKALWAATVSILSPMFFGFLNALTLPDDDYLESMVSAWDRDNFIILPNELFGGLPGVGRIPLDQNIRLPWCIGVNMAMVYQKRRTPQEAFNSIVTSMVQNSIPIPQNLSNFLSLGIESIMGREYHNIGEIALAIFTPSAMDQLEYLAKHENFLGGKLRADAGDIPEYELGEYESDLARDLSRFMYSLGGDPDVSSKYNVDENGNVTKIHGAFDINAKEIPSYFSGLVIPPGTIDILATAYGLAWGAADGNIDEHITEKRIPIYHSFVRQMPVSLYRYKAVKEVRELVKEWKEAKKGAYNQAKRYGIIADNAETEQEKANAKKRQEAAEERYEIIHKNERIIELNKYLEVYDVISKYATMRRLGLITEKDLKNVLSEIDMQSIDEAEKECVANMNFILYEIKGLKWSGKEPERIGFVNE